MCLFRVRWGVVLLELKKEWRERVKRLGGIVFFLGFMDIEVSLFRDLLKILNFID